VILNRRTLLASIGLVLPVVGAQAATMTKKKAVHDTKAATKRAPVGKPHTTHVSAVRSHHPAKPHVAAQS
jgi:hypothetical protein